MLITCGGNILIPDSDAAMVLFTQHGASGRPFRMVDEVSSPPKLWAFSSPSDYTTIVGVCSIGITPSLGDGVANIGNKSSGVLKRMIVTA